MQSNGVGAEGAAILCKALHDNTTVHAVNFNDNLLYDTGAEVNLSQHCIALHRILVMMVQVA